MEGAGLCWGALSPRHSRHSHKVFGGVWLGGRVWGCGALQGRSPLVVVCAWGKGGVKFILFFGLDPASVFQLSALLIRVLSRRPGTLEESGVGQAVGRCVGVLLGARGDVGHMGRAILDVLPSHRRAHPSAKSMPLLVLWGIVVFQNFG